MKRPLGSIRICYVRMDSDNGMCGHQHYSVERAANCRYPNSLVYAVDRVAPDRVSYELIEITQHPLTNHLDQLS